MQKILVYKIMTVLMKFSKINNFLYIFNIKIRKPVINRRWYKIKRF